MLYRILSFAVLFSGYLFSSECFPFCCRPKNKHYKAQPADGFLAHYQHLPIDIQRRILGIQLDYLSKMHTMSVQDHEVELRTGGNITALVLSNYGSQAAITGDAAENNSYKIHLWDRETEKYTRFFDGFSRPAQALAFSLSDNKLLASVAPQNPIKIWDIRTRNVVCKSHSMISDVGNRNFKYHALWFNNNVVTAYSSDAKQTFDIASDIEEFSLLKKSDERMSTFSSDGSFLARDQGLMLFDDLGQLRSYEAGIRLYPSRANIGSYTPVLASRNEPIASLAMSPDTQLLVESCGGILYLWALPSEKLITQIQLKTTAKRLAISRDNTVLAAAYNKFVSFFQADAQKLDQIEHFVSNITSKRQLIFMQCVLAWVNQSRANYKDIKQSFESKKGTEILASIEQKSPQTAELLRKLVAMTIDK